MRKLDVNQEHAALATGETTPRRRAQLHGLDIQVYLQIIYPESSRLCCLLCRKEYTANSLREHRRTQHGEGGR